MCLCLRPKRWLWMCIKSPKKGYNRLVRKWRRNQKRRIQPKAKRAPKSTETNCKKIKGCCQGWVHSMVESICYFYGRLCFAWTLCTTKKKEEIEMAQFQKVIIFYPFLHYIYSKPLSPFLLLKIKAKVYILLIFYSFNI
jgi:hypothetical protein